ncbi:MAG: diacylglycerol/lipid kinase family protein [Actinomycetota bacterium]
MSETSNGHPMSDTTTARPSGSRRLAAVAAFLCEIAVVVVALTGVVRSPGAVFGAIACVVVADWGIGEFVTHLGRRRAIGAGVAVLAAIVAIVLLLVGELFRILLAAYVLAAAAAALTVIALRVRGYAPPEHRTPPPKRAFFLMNPWSGGGKVEKFKLDELARSKGAEVVILEKGMDVPSVLRDAAARGADLLGAAGGDGTQALVAEVAAERDLPMIVIPAGTRNHFALDLGLDRDDPRKALEALGPDGVELRIDLGRIGDRPFVNNVSLGAYAEIISDPKYRDAKLATVLAALPEVAGSEASSGLRVQTPRGEDIQDPNLIQVGNNPYDHGSLKNANRRPRLDTGELGVDVVRFSGARELRELMRDLESGRNRVGALHRWSAQALTVTGRDGEVAAGVDGEYVTFPSPLEIASRPGVLRIRVPSKREPPLTQTPRGVLETLRSLWSVAAGSEPDLEAA